MDQHFPKSPRESAGFFSRLFFWWITPLIWKGSKQNLGISDLYTVLDEDRSNPLGDILEASWNEEAKRCHPSALTGRRPSLFKVLWRLFGPRYLVLGILVGFGELVIQLAQPICLGLLIRCVEEGQGMKSGSAMLFFAGLILASILYPIANHTYFFQSQRQGMQIRIACSSLIYRKALQMNLDSLRKVTTGQIVNLLSNDVNRFDQFLAYLHFIWIAPVQLSIVIWILWGYFGAYCLTGTAVLVLFTPLQGIMGRSFGKLRSKTAIRTDTRLRILNEVISGIQIIKIQVWEALFSERLIDARREEISRIRKTAMLRAINLTLHNISSKLIVFITLLVYVLMEHHLSAEKVFVTIAFYNSVRRVFTYCVPLGVANWAEVKISIKRIQEFLISSEIEHETSKTLDFLIEDDLEEVNHSAISLNNFCARWDPNAPQLTLKMVSLDIPTHSLVAVVGRTGSGKSSFLQAILRELSPLSGKILINGNVSYAPQEPWIFEGTVRENILFGQPFDITWYNQVINACALKRDMTLLPYGDQTIVGDKGAGLSGGQMARINLARAVYSKSDIILLDDPLSAVDTQVANHIFNECILGVLKNRTIVLVTHQVQFLSETDKIILLENGSIQNFGLHPDLLSELNVASYDPKDIGSIHPSSYKIRRRSILSTTSEINIEEWNVEIEDDEEGDDTLETVKDSKGSEEPISVDSRSRSLYWKYIRAGTGVYGITLFAILSIIAQILSNGSDYWLQIWIKSECDPDDVLPFAFESRNISKSFIQMIQADHNVQIYIYAIIFTSLVVVSLLRTLFYFQICMRSSIQLHNNIFSSVLSAPMQFFHQNPPGRILNVFSKDFGVVDELLPATLFEALEAACSVTGVLVIVSIINPILMGPSVILVCLLFFVRRLFIGTARNVKRLEGSLKSPVFSHMSSSLNGLVIIRAFKADAALRNQFDTLQDIHTSAWFLVLSTTRWLAFVVEFLSVMFISCVALSFVFFGLDGPAIGLAISSAMTLSSMFQWGVRQSAETESQLISVERVTKFSKIKPESGVTSKRENDKPDPTWPSEGAISFEAVTVSFQNESDDIQPVLHNITFKIVAGEKIGIVGRSGGGKSTLISCLVRLVDPFQGKIEIDGQCISNIGLKDLRSRISIIAQEPVLFSGTLRQNLDPEGKHTDEEIWGVIRRANLDNTLKHIPSGLDGQVGDKGSNFSVGQKQLFCLARALLQRNKILVLDEATASLDKETDEVIQATVRKSFSDCTTISIAHRLDTIIDCDKVLVLDAGRVMEFDSPYTLLSSSCGYFYSMVEELGQSSVESLTRRAEKVNLHKNGHKPIN